MKAKLLALIVACTMTAPLWAKPSAPLQFQLSSNTTEALGETTRYTVSMSFTPLSQADRIIFQVEVPKGFTLMEGFRYWEGELTKHEAFAKTWTLEGPTESEGTFEVVAQMEMPSAKAAKALTVKLSPQAMKEKATYPALVIEKAKADGTRRIRRE